MIQPISNHVNNAYQRISSYLPSKGKLKLAAKVAAASVAVFAVMEVGYYYYYFSVPWRVPFEKVFILNVLLRVFRKISEKGKSFFNPRNFNKGIAWCSWSYCYFYPKIDSWYVMLKDDFFNLY